MYRNLFTSESVTEGHPDKICDAIADGILDEVLTNDPSARVACEVVVSTGFVLILGELTTHNYVDLTSIARDTIKSIGYDTPQWGFNGNTCAILSAVKEQSPDIAHAVDQGEDIGAGDQGMMFGFACNENDSYMPTPIFLAHKLAKKLAAVRKDLSLPYLGPDGKTQVTVEYDHEKPVRVDTIVLSTQHAPDIDQTTLKKDVLQKVILPVIDPSLIDDHTIFLINPSGRFTIGGPVADTGLTGRKIMVDTYGGLANHGGGSFSGKDPTKVDKSGAYAARYIAKNLVVAGLLEKVELELSYAIGVPKPISISINDFGTAVIPLWEIMNRIEHTIDLRPKAIIERFNLCKPIYRQISCYGHFGRTDLDLPWERTDLAADLMKEC